MGFGGECLQVEGGGVYYADKVFVRMTECGGDSRSGRIGVSSSSKICGGSSPGFARISYIRTVCLQENYIHQKLEMNLVNPSYLYYVSLAF